MSTRSMIGYADPASGAVYAVYCHFDGQPTGVGQTLMSYWNSEEKAQELTVDGLSMRGLSPYSDRIEYYTDEPCSVYDSIEEFLNSMVDSAIEYVYLYADGGWYVKYNNVDE